MQTMVGCDINDQGASSGWGSGPSDVVLCVWGFLIGPPGAALTLTRLLPVHLSLHEEAESVSARLIIAR